MALTLQGCNQDVPSQPQQYVQPVQPPAGSASDIPNQYQPQVVYQQQPQQEDHTLRDGLIGGGIGYLLGRHTATGSGNGSGGYVSGGGHHAPTHTTVNNTVVKKVYVQQNVRQIIRPPTPTTAPRIISPRPESPSFNFNPRRK